MTPRVNLPPASRAVLCLAIAGVSFAAAGADRPGPVLLSGAALVGYLVLVGAGARVSCVRCGDVADHYSAADAADHGWADVGPGPGGRGATHVGVCRSCAGREGGGS